MCHRHTNPVIPAEAGIPLQRTGSCSFKRKRDASFRWHDGYKKSPSFRRKPESRYSDTATNEKHPAVYIMASRYRGTLYVGVTSALWSRVCDHKNGTTPGFTSRYGVKMLVWYEHHYSMQVAIRRKKQIKGWKRSWKFQLVESMNPEWNDLHDSIDVTATLFAEEAGPQLSLG